MLSGLDDTSDMNDTSDTNATYETDDTDETDIRETSVFSSSGETVAPSPAEAAIAGPDRPMR